MIEKMNTNEEWILEKAAEEDCCIISVGGLANKLSETSEESLPVVSRCLNQEAFSRLIEFRMRELQLTVERLATLASLELTEVLGIVEGLVDTPEPRTVYQLALILELPSQKLMVLSGLAEEIDGNTEEEAILFAARSESIDKLSPQEHNELKDFVRYLAES